MKKNIFFGVITFFISSIAYAEMQKTTIAGYDIDYYVPNVEKAKIPTSMQLNLQVMIKDPTPLPKNYQPILSKLQLKTDRSTSTKVIITYIQNGKNDAFGEQCYTFPEQAKINYEAAVSIWANNLDTKVPINIEACWANFSGSTLGYSASYSVANFTNAPYSDTYYNMSLGDSLAGSDLYPSYPDIFITFNGQFNWYYGTDGNTPSNKMDLLTVVLHEIGHGLNLSGGINYSGGYGGYNTYPNIYDRFITDNSGKAILSNPNWSIALGNALTSNNLYFNGAKANAANNNNKVKIYAPSSWISGSSYSHLDYNTFNNTSNQLMVYAVSSGEAIHDPGKVTLGMFDDMGWKLANSTSKILPRILADVNGDGMADAIGFSTEGVSVALSNGASFDKASLWLADFGYNQGWTNDTSLRKMADVNGDGMADIVGFGSEGIKVALSNGSDFDNASLWLNDFGYNQGWRKDKSLRILADVNGDGMTDIVAFGNKGISVALSTGSDFGQASLWVQDFGYNQGWRNDKGLRMMADVNGDGKADIVGFGNNGVSVALSNGNSFVNAQRWVNDFGYKQGWRNNKGLRFMSDVNGDGKADIVGFGNNGVSVALSNGNSFVNAQRWVNDFGYNQGWRNNKGLRLMSDVNGDGKVDIVGFGNNGVSVAYSNGNSFTGTSRKIDDFGYNQGWKNNKHLRLMADVDGDGADDVVGFGNTGISVSPSTGQNFDSSSLWLNDLGYNQGWEVDFTPYQEQQ